MKKYIAIVISMMLAFSLCACSRTSDLFSENTSVSVGEQADASEDASLKVGFIFSSDGDAPDTVARMEGIKRMQEKTGLLEKQIVIKDSVKRKKCAEEIEDLVKQNCKLIFSADPDCESLMIEAAAAYPEVQFCQEDGQKAKDSGLSNFHNYYSRIYESYYVAGVVAGMKLNHMLDQGTISSDSCVIGFAASEENPENISCYSAFYLGVGQVCSQASMLVRYVGSEGVYDDDGACARQLIAAGARLLSQHTYTTAVAAVCAENDTPVVGNEINIIAEAPKEALTSAATDWSVYYSEAVDALVGGETMDADWCGGYAEGVNIITQLNDSVVAEGTVDKVAQVEKSLRMGSLDIFDTETFTVDGESLVDLVKSSQYKSYRPLVTGGAFHESKNQSAPSFDLLIDGITVSTYDYLAEEETSTTEEETN